MIVDVAYGAKGKKIYIVETTNSKGVKECSEPMTRKQAKQVAKKIARIFEIPISKI